MCPSDGTLSDEVQVVPEINIDESSGSQLYASTVRNTDYLIPIDEWELDRSTYVYLAMACFERNLHT